MPDPLALLVGDPPSVWEDLGFVGSGGVVWVGGVALVLGGELKGIRAWSLDQVDGIPSLSAPTRPAAGVPAHPNGVVSLDHLVLATPDLERTITSLEVAGFGLRRRRDAGSGADGHPLQQAFFRVGPTILEVVGSPNPAPDATPDQGVPVGIESISNRRQGGARFYGLAFTVADLEETAAYLGDRLRPPKEAVQPGRRIATLDRAAGSTVAIAFMSPHVAVTAESPPAAGRRT